jgi:hypothetical protein
MSWHIHPVRRIISYGVELFAVGPKYSSSQEISLLLIGGSNSTKEKGGVASPDSLL